MSAEIVTATETPDLMPTPVVVPNGDQHTVEAKAAVPRRQRRVRQDEDDDDEDASGGPKLTKPLRELQNAEDKNLRDYLTDLGLDNATVRIDIHRVEPDKVIDPKTGKSIKTNGHLESVKQFIDEEYIKDRHGGGTYKLKINKPGDDGKYHYFKMRELHIGGDPRTDHLPRNVEVPAAGASASAGESPSIVKDVLTVMKDQLDKANDRASHVTSPTGPDPAMMLLVEQLRQQNTTQAAEMRELRKEMADARNARPEKTEGDAFKDGLVKQLLDGDSSRLNAVRLQYESELRQAKADAKSLEDRIRDQFERDKVAIEAAHQREIAFIKHSNEVTLAAVNVSLGTSKDVLNAQIKALERENAQLREDVKELRAKKEKGPLEIAKEMETYKKIFGEGEDKEEKDTADKIVDVLTNPAAIEFAQGIFGKKGAAAPPPQQVQQQQRPRIVRAPNGDSFVQRGTDLIPVKKRGQKVAIAAAEGQAPTEVEIPALDPAKLEMAISYLERAYSGNQDPETVAVSARPIMPEEIMQSIQALGIDVFFAKVAKLPSASPLASQAGKNWIRKVGKALVGE